MKYYHATTEDKAISIVNDGEIKVGIDKVTYLCTTPGDAVKFVAIRGNKQAIVLEIEVPDESLIQESFDHNRNFFGCRAFTYPVNDVRITLDYNIGYSFFHFSLPCLSSYH